MTNYDEFKEVVIKRLETMPKNIRVSMGSMGTFSREDLIHNVNEGTPLGKFVLKMQAEYLKSMKRGLSNE